MGGMASAYDPSIRAPAEEGIGPARLGRVERQRLCHVGAGQGQISQKIQRASQDVMRCHPGHRVLHVLRQVEQLFGKLTRFGQLCAHQIKHPEAVQYGHEVRCLCYPPA